MNQQIDLYSDEGAQDLSLGLYNRNLTPHNTSVRASKSGLHNHPGGHHGMPSAFTFDEASMLVKIREQSTLIDKLKNENAEIKSIIGDKDRTIDELL